MRCRTGHLSRIGRSIVPLTIYLGGFVILLVGACHYYLLPALTAAATATPRGKRILSAQSRLVLTVLLVILLLILWTVLHTAQRLKRRRSSERKPTVYPDAWEESARRIKTPPPE